jgi:hypothetical protein
MHIGQPDARPGLQHQHGDHQHQEREQRQQLLAVEHFSEDRSCERADDSRGRENQRARPPHGAAASMIRQIDRRVGGHRDGAGTDRHMGVGHADHVDHQRYCEDRSAAPDQAKRKSNQRSRCQSQQALHRGDYHSIT